MFSLVYPMFAMVCLTMLILTLTLVTRVSAVRQGKMDARYFKTFNYGTPTEAVVKTSRQFSNLFEIPVLFYAACVIAMQLALSSDWLLIWAWVFVAARYLQAYIHLGRNKIYPRMASFFLGCGAVFAMWLVIILNLPSLP